MNPIGLQYVMRILLTGASSFTGMWFANALIADGHTVTTPLKSSLEAYSGLRRERIDHLLPHCEVIPDCPYGSDAFLDLIRNRPFDIFCHHAADVTNYKSADFDVISALKNNTGPLKQILQLLVNQGCHRLILTGSVFEQGEGMGTDDLKAFSPYGLSKGLTSDYFRYYCSLFPIHLGKFVIPNPFGPYEEFRFTSFLIREWKERKQAFVSMPAYVRDNIPVSLLAKAYAFFAERLPETPGYSKFNPSCYTGSQGDFTKRFAVAMKSRLQLPCEYSLGVQTEFTEPLERINLDQLNPQELNWDEDKAWDELAVYYAK